MLYVHVHVHVQAHVYGLVVHAHACGMVRDARR
jgi:hypothetical protein